ncbi:hypothetical protein DH2020_017189 [Rehmannia glutinosa]|uniref:Mo25-like protein n=1 Tax=Rehmannia glutinosa TaxID=99300 RepID=A0ABR0WRA0_REHGL
MIGGNTFNWDTSPGVFQKSTWPTGKMASAYAAISASDQLLKSIRGLKQVSNIGGCLSSGGQPPPRRASAPQAVVRKLSLPENNDGGADNAKVKALFKSKPKTPVDLVRQTRDLLIFVDRGGPDTKESKRDEKVFFFVYFFEALFDFFFCLDVMMELGKLMRELKQVLYGDSESEPVAEACAQLTQEFFRENTLRLLIICLPKLNLERQQVQSRLIACDYLEKNIDLMDTLIAGYENTDMALHYGAMLRECIRHQSVARCQISFTSFRICFDLQVCFGIRAYEEIFDYIQLPNFDIASDAAATFKGEYLNACKHPFPALLTAYLASAEYNSKLLESTNYITRRQAVKLLGDILLDRSNSAVMTRYVCSRDNLRILMNLLRESSKSIQIEAFHVFKLFAANQNKPPDIVGILCTNKNKLLRLFADLKTDKEDEQFEADKAQVVKEIAALEPK